MHYNMSWLMSQAENNTALKYIFFWGHQPSKIGQIDKSCFSQWWISPFTVGEIVYPSAEHWMMAGKARLYNDHEILDQILVCKSPAEAKKLGREVKGFDQDIWEQHNYALVVEGNFRKFSQDKKLGTFLINTGDRVLVESSPADSIWGIGMAENDPDILHPYKWKGTNLLGFALMEVRDKLRK